MRYQRAQAQFTDRVDAVEPGEWDAPALPEWSVVDLVAHLTGEQLWAPLLASDGNRLWFSALFNMFSRVEVKELRGGFRRLYIFSWLEDLLDDPTPDDTPEVRIGDLWIE